MNNGTKIQWVKLWVIKHHDAILVIDREDAGDIFQNIIRYANGEELSEMSPKIHELFKSFQQDIDECFGLYDGRVNNARKNGKKGGRPTKQEQAEREAEQTVDENAAADDDAWWNSLKKEGEADGNI